MIGFLWCRLKIRNQDLVARHWKYDLFFPISYQLFPPATKSVELIIFSKPKRIFGRHDCADCKQRGTN